MKFSEVVGQENVIEVLLRDFKAGRLPHATMFSSEPGMGGLPLAMALAQYMNCENPSDTDSCGECASCGKVSKMIHPDVHFSFPTISKGGKPPISNDFIEAFRQAVLAEPYLNYYDWIRSITSDQKQGNITRDECRSISNKLGLKSYESKYKVLIMWLPEHLGKQGNALLKLVEEPPANTFFFFITNDYESVLNTIMSRTRLIKLRSPSHEQVKGYLTEARGIDPVVAENAAYIGHGNTNVALKASEESSLDLTDQFREWMLYCYKQEVINLMNYTAKLGGENRDTIKQFLSHAMVVLRECMTTRFVEGHRIYLPEKHRDFVKKFAALIDEWKVERIMKMVSDASYHIDRNANAKIVLFDLSLNIKQELRRERAA